MPTNLPLDRIVQVTVSVAQQQATEPTFNQGCVIGSSGVIPSTGANPRLRPYSSTAAMLVDGFTSTDPEYITAQLYFAQSPAPSTLWVGAQDPSAVNTLVPHAASEGTGYVVGDIVTLAGSGATARVSTVSSGAVTALVLLTGGTGASVTTGIATTGGTGSGLEVDVTAIGESALAAATACRIASASWYPFMVCGAADADHEALALFAQSATPQTVYMASTAEAAAAAGTAGNLLLTLQTADYNRVQTTYATTQNGAAPNNIYAAAAVMGMAMGLNTGLAGSYFTQKFKQLAGVSVEPLTLAQATTIENANGNVFVSYPGYTFYEQGVMANGQFFDEILGLDMLASDVQIEVANELAGMSSVPQTDAGQALLIAAVNRACAQSQSRGFIGSGTWDGPQVLNLATGTPLPTGYSVQSPSYSTQSSADRKARKSMPIYVCVTESGSAHSVAVQINVQE